MSQYFTRGGDDGYTGWLGPGRMAKFHPRAEAVGALDEASAALGLARAAVQAAEIKEIILVIQKDIYTMMAEISAPPENAARFRAIDADAVRRLESLIERISAGVVNPGEFILPGDSPASAALAFARTVVRRAERHTAGLLHSAEIENPALVGYLNRLSSLCFVLELDEIKRSGKDRPTPAKDPHPE